MRARRRDVFKVRRRPAYEAAQADDRRKPPVRGRLFCGKRNLERAWHLDDAHIISADACRLQRVQGARLQPVGDEVVELRHHDRELHARRFLRSFDGEHCVVSLVRVCVSFIGL